MSGLAWFARVDRRGGGRSRLRPRLVLVEFWAAAVVLVGFGAAGLASLGLRWSSLIPAYLTAIGLNFVLLALASLRPVERDVSSSARGVPVEDLRRAASQVAWLFVPLGALALGHRLGRRGDEGWPARNDDQRG